MPSDGGFWKSRFNPLHFFLSFLSKNVLINWFHELCHLFTLRLFGGDGYVDAGALLFWVKITKEASKLGNSVMSFAGGLGSALLCLLFWLIDSDIEDRIVWRALGLIQFFYGLVEGAAFTLNLYHHIYWAGFLAMIAAAVYSFATSRKMWELKPDDTE